MHRLKVQYGEKFLVDLNEKTCTCNEFMMDELPCRHDIVANKNCGYNIYAYCSHIYTREAYKSTYKEAMNLVGNPSDWTISIEVTNKQVLPLILKKKSGRPKKQKTLLTIKLHR